MQYILKWDKNKTDEILCYGKSIFKSHYASFNKAINMKRK